MKTRQKRAIPPPLRYYLDRVLRDMGGVSHWAAKDLQLKPNAGSFIAYSWSFSLPVEPLCLQSVLVLKHTYSHCKQKRLRL